MNYSTQTLDQVAQGSRGVHIRGGIEKTSAHGIKGHGLVMRLGKLTVGLNDPEGLFQSK